MRTGWRRTHWVIVVAMLTGGCASTDPGVVARDASPTGLVDAAGGDSVGDDPNVRILTLSNGLTVYIRSNQQPGNSVEMRLAVNAGSGQEDSDQSGTAHFLEHMMFNGTTQFPANDLIDTLRGFGMQFGADVTAYTSYDETVFELTVPLSQSANVGTGLDVLREWLSAATLDPDQVESEKGVVLDEWRQGDQSFEGRVGNAGEAMLLTGSGYEHRLPIGTDAAIQAMTPELLRRFYDTWYRPDNAAIMVVGDIDADEIEAEIRDRFEPLQPRGTSPQRTDPALPAYGVPTAKVLVDPDAVTGDASITLPGPHLVDGTVASLRHDTLIALAFDMIAKRLNDDVSRGTAPFTSAAVIDNGSVRRLAAPSVTVSGKPGQLQASLDALTAEFERVRRYGFDAVEFDQTLRSYRSGLQADFDGSDTVQDSDYISRYIDHFLSGQPIPDADTTFHVYGAIYDDVTPDAVGSAFNELLGNAAPYVMLVAPESLAGTPSEEDVLARLAALPSIDLAAREKATAGATELMTAPDPVTETATDSLESDDVFVAPTMLTFANGARVVLNPTSIADNDVYLAGTSPGGLSLVPDADVPEALNAAAVVTSSGLGDLDPVELDNVLSDASVALDPSIGQTSEDFSGSSTTDDLELLFQMVNQYMSKPRFDQVALDATVSSLQSYVDDPTTDPDLAGYIAYSQARWGTELRYEAIPSATQLAGLDLPTTERVWRDRFSNAGDWVFAVSGDFDLDTARDLARRYIGTLAGGKPTERYKDFQIDPPSTIVTKEVHAGTGDKGSLTVDWNTAIPDPEVDAVYADVLSSVLNVRLTDHIREQLGASYSPSAYVGLNTEPDEAVETYLNITGDPTAIEKTSSIVIGDVTSLRNVGPTHDEFDAAVAEMSNTYSYFDNQSIGDLLVKAPTKPEVITQYKSRSDVLDSITPVTLQKFITQVMPLDRYIEVRTVPA
ncbi:MAG: insulinase family protein [Ilumatobacteraceae bacterium]|nr:insulinase family protein [Ilumatobacteraceae bacterium]